MEPQPSSSSSFQSSSLKKSIILSFLLTVLISLPFSWYTTKITRLNLPTERIKDWSASLICPVRFPIHLDLQLQLNQEDQTKRKEWVQVAGELKYMLSVGSDWVGTSDQNQDQDTGDLEMVQPAQGSACIDWYLTIDNQSLESRIEGKRIQVELEGEGVGIERGVQEEQRPRSVSTNEGKEDDDEPLVSDDSEQIKLLGIPPRNAVRYQLSLSSNPFTSSIPSPFKTLHLSTPTSTSTSTSTSQHLCIQLSRIFDLPFRSLACSNPSDKVQVRNRFPPKLETSISHPKVIPYSPKLKLIFSLMNQDSSSISISNPSPQSQSQSQSQSRSRSSGFLDWEIGSLLSFSSSTSPSPSISSSTQPSSSFSTLLESLSSTHQFQLETQIQWFAPLAFEPTEINHWKKEERRRDEIREQERVSREMRLAEKEERRKRWEWEREKRRVKKEGERREREIRKEEERERKRLQREEEREVVQETQEVGVESSEREVEGEELETPGPSPSDPHSKVESLEIEEPEEVEEEEDSEFQEIEGLEEEPTQFLPNEFSNQSTYLVEHEDLGIFVNSEKWSLTSEFGDTSNRNLTVEVGNHESTTHQSEKVLHFILFIPSIKNRPLGIRNPNASNKDGEEDMRSKSNGWLIPQWGGVVIYNPEENSNPELKEERSGMSFLSSENLEKPFELFSKQLMDLIGLPKSEEGVDREILIQTLQRSRILENLRESINTLRSIVKLKEKILNLGIEEDVKIEIERSLEFLDEVKRSTSSSNSYSSTSASNLEGSNITEEETQEEILTLPQILQLSTSASLHASSAFFNPSMLGMLYFPDEHRYAVLTPLFGPIAVPLLVAVLGLVKEAVKGKGEGKKNEKERKKEEKKKKQ